MNKEKEPSEATKKRWHQDPSNWIWGILYYSKEDKRIFPPKKMERMGWTVNFANPMSIGAILIVILVLTILTNLIT